MEAEWECEVGGDAPVIEACWPGFVDLRWTPQHAGGHSARARSLPEAVQFPALGAALVRLNSERSPVWTSKCDFWQVLEPEAFDHNELDAPADCSAHAMGCYIDLLPRSEEQWPSPGMAAAASKLLCTRLRDEPLRCCRVDLITRQALFAPDSMGLGITAYITACGATPAAAKGVLEKALAAFANALCSHSTLQ